MTIYWILWIFMYGLLFQPRYVESSTNSTATDSSISNLVVEGSTNENFGKQLRTIAINSSDSFSLNNVNTDSFHPSTSNGECKSEDCTQNLHISTNTDNSSSASKILWNLVNNVKITTLSPESDEVNLDEESTETLNFNSHSSNHSSAHNVSFNSNDNELDSEINVDNNLLKVHSIPTDEVMSNVFSRYDFTTTTTESSMMTTEFFINEIGKLEENDTIVLESTEMHPLMILYDSNASDILNVSEHITTPNTQDTTAQSDNELDFTTYFSDSLNSVGANYVKRFDGNMDAQPYFSENSTTAPFSDFDASSEHNKSTPLFSVIYDSSTESEELESKDTESVTIVNSDLHTSETKVPVITANVANDTVVYFDYDTSLDTEHLKSPDSQMMNVTDANNNTHTSPIDVSNLWESEEILTTPPNSRTGEISVIDSETRPFILTTEKQDTHLDTLNESTSSREKLTDENTDSTQHATTGRILGREMTSHESTETSVEAVEYIFNPESTESINHTQVLNNNFTVNDSLVKSYLSTAIAHAVSTEAVNFNVSQPMEINKVDLISTAENFSRDSTEISPDITYTHDLSVSDIMKQNASVFVSSIETEIEDSGKTSTKSFAESTVTPNTDPNINIVFLNTVQGTSTLAPHFSNNLNEIENNLPSLQTKLHTVSSAVTSSPIPISESTATTASSVVRNMFVEKESVTSQAHDISTDNDTGTKIMVTSRIFNENISSSESFGNERDNPDISLASSENNAGIDFATTEMFISVMNHTEDMEIQPGKTNLVTFNDVLASSTVKTTLIFENVNTENAAMNHTENVILPITEYNFHETTVLAEKEKSSFSTKESVTEFFSEGTTVSDIKHYDTMPKSETQEIEITSPTSNEVLSVTETHREGKHIPFSSTLIRRTTPYPVIFNITVKTHSHQPQPEATERSLMNLRYNQIKAESLTPEERSNLINAVVKLADKYYSKEELNETIAVIHLWLLHSVADEYKNDTLNLSASNDGKLDEIPFENLPQILYVHPTPEVNLPNISFSFVVHNKWRNETFPVDIVLTILNLHTENLKKLLKDIEEIHFSQGLVIQKHDLMSVIIEKYGIILLSTCLITVGMIFLLICIVIYYRRKTRHSAHCLTDDKLHRNMQEAMGIDLNPAVIILQEEIREKAALNGNKVSSLDDDEGWLAPIGDVPVEDNNAPFVQDTKL